jgi:regulator of sigma E protease
VGNYLWLVALLSVNLFLLNLLPIPILDGGHILFLFIEKIRGRPVSERVFNAALWAGLILLVALIVFVTYSDIARLL